MIPNKKSKIRYRFKQHALLDDVTISKRLAWSQTLQKVTLVEPPSIRRSKQDACG